jgi:serine/threonine-protein kinase RsbW
VREFVSGAVRQLGGEEEDVFAFELTVDEAMANVFEHSYGEKPGRVHIAVSLQGRMIETLIRSWGQGFDPSDIPDPDIDAPLEEREVGGLGIFFMRQLMQEVKYGFDAEAGNTVRLRRIIESKKGMGMNLRAEPVEDRGDVAVIHVQGSVDGSNFGELIQQAQSLYAAGKRRLVVDLAECDYMSSAGLVALHSIVKLLSGERLPDTEQGWAVLRALDGAREGTQRNLAIVNPSPRVERVLTMAGMQAFIPIYRDLSSAIAALE